jgi:magnesium transporter
MRILRSPDLAELRALRTSDEFFWLDLNDPDPTTVHDVGGVLDLHDLAIEDTNEFGQRPKIDSYGDQLLMVYFGATDDDGQPSPVEIHVHVSPRFVVTVHRGPCREFDAVQEMTERRPPVSEQALIYRILDALTDSVLDVLDRVVSRVDEYESQIFDRPRARDRDEMAILRRSLGQLRRVLVIQRQVFERAVERIESLPGLDASLVSYFRDVGDHLWRAVDEAESARDSLQGMLDTYTNEVQERLTIVATIFLPLTVVTGFFGQNFNWLINHIGEAWAFWALGSRRPPRRRRRDLWVARAQRALPRARRQVVTSSGSQGR